MNTSALFILMNVLSRRESSWKGNLASGLREMQVSSNSGGKYLELPAIMARVLVLLCILFIIAARYYSRFASRRAIMTDAPDVRASRPRAKCDFTTLFRKKMQVGEGRGNEIRPSRQSHVVHRRRAVHAWQSDALSSAKTSGSLTSAQN
jgi:hypothetical protein